MTKEEIEELGREAAKAEEAMIAAQKRHEELDARWWAAVEAYEAEHGETVFE